MAVNKPNEYYSENAKRWRKCRDFVAGSDTVKDAGALYVPRPSGLNDLEFRDYIERGAFFNASQRTVDSLIGLIMMKPPQVEISPSAQEFVDYIDGNGSKAEDFARDALFDVLVTGGGCALVDRPERPEGIVTRQQEQAAGLRPYASWYPVENVLDWRYGIINGRRELVFLKLAEKYDEIVDEWDVKYHDQVRVFDLVESKTRCRVFRKGGAGWETISETFLTKANGQPFPYVPAVLFGPVKNEFEKPPILDLVEVNKSHWQNSCDRQNALHFSGQPLLMIAAAIDPDEKIRVGAKTALIVENGGDAKYISLDAGSVSGLENSMNDLKQEMAALGARMLIPEGSQAESGEALAIRRGGENSALSKLADSVSRSMELVIETASEWEGSTANASYKLNTDYLPSKMSAQELTAWVSAYNAGTVSTAELFEAMKTGGLIRDDKTLEDHNEELQGLADTVLIDAQSE